MADEPQRFCLGIAYMPGRDPRIAKGQDGGRDFLTESELEKAAWSYLRNGPKVNAFHVAGTEGCATVVESSIHRGPDWDIGDGIVVRKGTWLVGAILDQKMWQAALDGKVNGWSPEGTARRRRVAKEGAVPIAKSVLPAEGDEEFSELVDCDFPTMGLVGKGANGIPRFLVMKDADGDAAGLLDPEFVRDLIGKQADNPEPTIAEQVTMSGSPAAVAAFIHKAAQGAKGAAEPDGNYEAIVKAKYNKADRDKMASSGAAMSDGSYPIKDEEDLSNAIHAVGRGSGSHGAIRKHIITRAKSLGKSSMIPDNWAADGSLKEGSVSKESQAVAKDAGDLLEAQTDNGVDGMDPTVPLAAPDGDAPGDPTDPGSPAWESIDAATAQKWTSILARAMVALNLLSEREMLEAASADPDDAENAWDLQDACCAIDYVISVLAPYAVSEQSEADCGADAMAAIGKAVASLEEVPLDTLTALGQVRKAGRVLSSANEALIRSAGDSLQKVLQALPSAPVADDQVTKSKETAVDDGQTETAPAAEADVAKAEEAGEAVAKEDGTEAPAGEAVAKADGLRVVAYGKDGEPVTISPAAITKATPGQILICGQRGNVLGLATPGQVFKADAAPDGDGGKPEQVAVYDADGNLVGVADPADITPLANVKAPAKNDDGEKPEGEPAKPAADGDMTPAPAAGAGTPADDVNKQQDTPAATDDTQDAHEVLKGIVAEAVTAALDARAPAGDIAKSADVAAALEEVETLKARIAKVEEQPAQPKVFTNGQTPPAHMLRGQDRQGPPAPVDVAKALERKRELYTADAPEQNRIAKEMQGEAIEALAAIQRR